ncbi:acyl carrier protein [Streptomyces avermitilis]|uniref:acyl carrier protein n=1 Tax=Streptomyces avermitilis TaxID=33903 RepID=UPI0033A65DCE
MENLYAAIAEVLGQKFGVYPADIRPDATLKDLELDSLAAVEFADVLQAELGIPIADSQFAGSTLREIADALQEQLKGTQ